MFPNSSSSSLPLAPPPEHNLFDASDDDDALDFDSPSPSPRPAAAAAPAARPAAPTRANRLSANGKQKDIEMAPIVGHRRRKSSLMQPVGGQHGQSVHLGQVPGRSITPIRGHVASSSVAEQPGILEDDGDSGSAFELDDTSRDSFSDEDNNEDEEMGLTSGERAEKRKKKQRSMRLDQRIVPEKSPSPMGRTTEDQSLMRQIMINGGLILLWYLFSLSLSLYNKWMFDKGRLNFEFPLFTTSMHMLVQFGLASTVLYFIPSLRPDYKRTSDNGRSRHEEEPNSGLTKMFYLTRIAPCGVATSLDIGFGNMSLRFISLSFYTMCKSSSLAFVLLFAFLFRLETPTWRLVAIIATMTAGVILMVSGEVKFELGGFFLVISAAFFSGFRWALTQLLLLRSSATSNPFSSIFYLSPIMFVVLFAMAIPVEGFGPLFAGLGRLAEKFGTAATPFFLLFPGCIAFLMIASEFALLQRTSVVTLSIAGIFKEVVTISAASVILDDKLTFVNFIGLAVTLAAIIAYNYVKITKMRADAAAGASGAKSGDAFLPVPSSDPDLDDSEESHGLIYQAPDIGESSQGNAADSRHKTHD